MSWRAANKHREREAYIFLPFRLASLFQHPDSRAIFQGFRKEGWRKVAMEAEVKAGGDDAVKKGRRRKKEEEGRRERERMEKSGWK